MYVVKETELLNTEPIQLFKLLYKHSRPIKKWIRDNSGSKADAEDTLQDAMIAFYQMIHKPDFRLTAQPDTLLFAIAKRIWYNHLRKHNRFSLEVPIDDLQLGEENGDALEKENMYTLMEKTLVLLGDKCSLLLELFYFQRLDMVQIAEKLDFRNEKVAKAMKYKCLEKARILVNAKKQGQ